MAIQRRFSIGTYSLFAEAKVEKDRLLTENPKNNYQIRRRKYNFDLMQRVTSKEADQVIHTAQKMYTKAKGKKHGHHNQSTV